MATHFDEKHQNLIGHFYELGILPAVDRFLSIGLFISQIFISGAVNIISLYIEELLVQGWYYIKEICILYKFEFDETMGHNYFRFF